jgi:ABC-type lipoprotein export system ATPase subunit
MTIIYVTHDLGIASYTRRIIHVLDGGVQKDELVTEQRFALDMLQETQVEEA